MAQSDTPLTRALAQCDRLTEALRREQARNVELAGKADRVAELELAYKELSDDYTCMQAETNARARRRARSWRERSRRSLHLFLCRLAELCEVKG